MSILVIDDDSDLRIMVCKMLIDEGYDVVDASNGKEGLQKLKDDPGIELVITDLIMPEQEGIETILDIKKDFSLVSILAISGGGEFDDNSYLRIAKGVGADLRLSKPFLPEELLKPVQYLLK